MAMATNSISGILSGCSNIGRILGTLIRNIQRTSYMIKNTIRTTFNWFKNSFQRINNKHSNKLHNREWKSIGVGTSLILNCCNDKNNKKQDLVVMKRLSKHNIDHDNVLMVSYFDIYRNKTLLGQILDKYDNITATAFENNNRYGVKKFIHWIQSNPS